VNGSFKGDLFGKVTCRLEDMPLRFLADGTYAAPEVRVDGGGAYNIGETIPNPIYSQIGVGCSPYGVAWMCGGKGYDAITVGPPPAPFSSSVAPENFPKMQWNGEVHLTKNLLLRCLDPRGNTIYMTNKYGKKCQFISEATFGITSKQRRNIVPILYLRHRTGITA
jgi:hypothetical protein